MKKLIYFAIVPQLLICKNALSADSLVGAIDAVRVCDTYGSGFFYLPGTETCLAIGGYVRQDLGLGLFGLDVDGDFIGDTYQSRSRAALRLDARSETELGTLRAYTQLNFDADNAIAEGGETVEIENAYIEIGGFRFGTTDSLFTTMTYYAGGVLRDDIIGYGPFATNQIAYTYTSETGLAVSFALEDGYGAQAVVEGAPHLVLGAAYTKDWGGLSAVAGYDAVSDESAAKFRLDLTLSPSFSAFVMVGAKSDASPPYSQFYGVWGGDWASWFGGTAKLSETLALNVQLSIDGDDNFSAVANAAYDVVPGLSITPEAGFYRNLEISDSDEFGAFLRLRRLF